MKINHVKGLSKRTFNQLEDLAEVSHFVREHYNPMTCDCKVIADALSERYSNLEPVEVGTMVFAGRVQQGGHVVCQIKGTDLVLDPTGDYATYSNTTRLKHDITPWLYQKVNDMYLSQNHLPMQFSDAEIESEEPFTEFDILRLSSGPFYNGLRSITF